VEQNVENRGNALGETSSVQYLNICGKVFGMDPLIILIPSAALLLLIQLFLVKDRDQLDPFGKELNSKNKKG
jgi:hypothetical protein